ncbi:MAG TPA: 50S ribosomal protein L24 [Actinomycetota bacterium]|nr:50S ribosomal protein L24 [Actinomycetota bacterium]
MHIRKGDEVMVLSGKDRGKNGRVVRVWPKTGKVMVEGVNQVKRHEPLRQQRGRQGMTGGIVTKEMPVQVSTVALVCSTDSCNGRARIGWDVGADGKKQRVCRKCGSEV